MPKNRILSKIQKIDCLPVSIDIIDIKNVLKYNFYNGDSMNDVFSSINSVNSGKKDQYGIKIISHFDNMNKIDVKSSQSVVYSATYRNEVTVILKKTKNKKDIEDLWEECYIGMVFINKLRYIVPNFMYTLGLFSRESDNHYSVLEKIDGKSLKYYLKSNKMSFKEFLNVFTQILFSLEVAQIHVSFTHYDLHVDNIVLRRIKTPYSYMVLLNDKRYDITAEKYIPTIIDYGFSTVKGDRTYGSEECKCYGIMNYSIQGADMYKLLFSCYLESDGTLRKHIKRLLLFYGNKDPYDLYNATKENLSYYASKYVKNNVYSDTATLTPLDFIHWILAKDIVKVKMSDRDVYSPNVNDISLFTVPKEELLLNYINIDTSVIKNIHELTNRILFIKIDQKYDKEIIREFEEITSEFDKILPYVDYLYIIYQLKLENVYKNFVEGFKRSSHYVIYQNYIHIIEKTRRWVETIKNEF